VELTCWSEGPASHGWLRPIRAQTRERLLSCREPASFHPQAMRCENLFNILSTPAPFRLLSIRAPASGGATDFFLASALFAHHPTLRSTGEEDARCAQPTSATQTNYVYPHLARSRLTLAGFPAGRSHGVLGSVRHNRGIGRFTTSRTASADRHRMRTSFSTASRPGDTSVGVFFPRHTCDRASDTPVAILALILSPHQASPVLQSFAVRPSFGKVGTGRRTRRPPRPPPRRLVKADICDDPECLLSAGTLPSIQWPLQPWCHEYLTAFGDVAPAEWHSRATLGLRPVLSRLWVVAGSPTSLSHPTPTDGFTRHP